MLGLTTLLNNDLKLWLWSLFSSSCASDPGFLSLKLLLVKWSQSDCDGERPPRPPSLDMTDSPLFNIIRKKVPPPPPPKKLI